MLIVHLIRSLFCDGSCRAEVPCFWHGMRYSLLRSLRALNMGEAMHYFENGLSISFWIGQQVICAPVGSTLIEHAMVFEAESHWMQGVRLYRLTYEGAKALSEAEIWWSSQTAIQKLRIALFE